jgi:small-conductance mechanosensitive channel
MNYTALLNTFRLLLPIAGIVVFALLLLAILRAFMRKTVLFRQNSFLYNFVHLTYFFIMAVAIAFVLPSSSARTDLMTLLGLLISTVVALSSATFVSNFMVGLMLRSVKSFNLGDFVKVQDYFGRISEENVIK